MIAAVLALALAGPPAGEEARGQQLTVFAAASLRESFAELAAAFEREHAGARVALSFAGSQELRAQLESGAPADVFASADEPQMAALGDLALAPAIFARNQLVLVTPADDPARIGALQDLPRAARIVLGADTVPAGAYAARLLQAKGAAFRASVEARVVSRELNVRQVLTKVALGEADAAIVYRTDALANQARVRMVELAAAEQPSLPRYPIAVLRAAPQPALARDFAALVLSQRGRAVLERHGFLAPEARPSSPARSTVEPSRPTASPPGPPARPPQSTAGQGSATAPAPPAAVPPARP